MESILKSLCVVVFLGSALYAHAATQGSEPNNENDEIPEIQIGESASEGGDFGKKFSFHRLRLQTDDKGSKKEYSPFVGKELFADQSGGLGVGGDNDDSTERQRKKPVYPTEKIHIDRISQQTGGIVSKKEHTPVVRKELPTTQSGGVRVGDSTERQNYPGGQQGKKPGYPIEKINIDKISQQTGGIISKKEYSPMVRKELPTTQSGGVQVGDNKDESTESENYPGGEQGKKPGYPKDKLNIDRRSQQNVGSISRKKYSWEELSTGQSGSSEVGGNKGESAERQKHQGGQQGKKPSYRRGYKRPEERQEEPVEESTEHKEPESSTRRYSRRGHARHSNSERSSSS